MKLRDFFIVSALLSVCCADHHVNVQHSSPLFSLDINDTKVSQNSADKQAVLPPRRMNGVVIFRDDFNTLSSKNWRYEVSMFGDGHDEFQVFSNDPKNSYTKNGYLYIKPTLTVDDPRFSAPNFLNTGVMDMKKLFGYCTVALDNGCYREGKDGLLLPIMSAKLMSNPSIKYGVVEVRARIPTGDWLWPAIWLMPKDSVYGGWPRSGEFDLMESRGNQGSYGVGSVTATIHYGPAVNEKGRSFGTLHSSNWASQFHVWKLEWTTTFIAVYVDDVLCMYADRGPGFWKQGGFKGKDIWAKGGKMAPFDQDFFVILNVSVGGRTGFFPDGKDNKPWKNGSPNATAEFWYGRKQWLPSWKGDDVAMLVDYVEMRTW